MLSFLNPLEHPVCLAASLWNTAHSEWHAHKPFAMFLVDILRPAAIVDLWAGHGDSYCAFCQAARALDASIRCYAIDTWQADAGLEAISSLRAHHDPLYGAFSELIRCAPEEALGRFSDGGVDLLHIGKVRPYEAVKRDFESYLPKMSRSGVVLLHGINLRQDGSGARKLWEEIKAGHPSFELMDGLGLGVLAVGEDCPKALSALAGLSAPEVHILRDLFSRLGEAASLASARTGQSIREMYSQIADLERLLRVKERYIYNIEHSARINEKTIIEKLTSFEEQLRLKDNHITNIEAVIANIEAVTHSREWTAVNAVYRFRDAVLPAGSRRRSALKGLKGLIKKKP
ncbi:MAG: class I SAM-dependent methyltransferase [Deltaproteobacteria bacterium]|nr:class I SAM-dependent methyltransferase [Deltaproteobacteria bacterium]